MSDVTAVWYLLAHNAPLIAVVPAARIKAGPIEQGTALPALSVLHVSSMPQHTIAGGASTYKRSRVQITAVVNTYPQLKTVLDLVRAALPRTHGTVNGVAIESVVMDLEGPDFPGTEFGWSSRSIDYIVTYNA